MGKICPKRIITGIVGKSSLTVDRIAQEALTYIPMDGPITMVTLPQNFVSVCTFGIITLVIGIIYGQLTLNQNHPSVSCTLSPSHNSTAVMC